MNHESKKNRISLAEVDFNDFSNNLIADQLTVPALMVIRWLKERWKKSAGAQGH